MKLFVLLIYISFVLLFPQCDDQSHSQPTAVPKIQIQEAENKVEDPELLSNHFVKEDSLTFNSFGALKLKKKINLESLTEKNLKS